MNGKVWQVDLVVVVHRVCLENIALSISKVANIKMFNMEVQQILNNIYFSMKLIIS